MWVGLPKATHPMGFLYMLDDALRDQPLVEGFGDFRAEVAGMTNSRLVWDYYHEFGDAHSSIVSASKLGGKVFYGPYQNPSDVDITPEFKARLGLIGDVWDRVDAVYYDELGMNTQGVQNYIIAGNQALALKGLARKEVWVNFTQANIYHPTKLGWKAPNIDVVGLEAYLDPAHQHRTVGEVSDMVAKDLEAQLAIVGNRRVFIIVPGYDRNGLWTNLPTLEAIQTVAYEVCYNRSNVEAIWVFSYGRKGGTRQYPTLKAKHQEIWDAIK